MLTDHFPNVSVRRRPGPSPFVHRLVGKIEGHKGLSDDSPGSRAATSSIPTRGQMGAPTGHSGAITVSAIPELFGASILEVGNLILPLKKAGYVAVDHLNVVRISSGIQLIAEEPRLDGLPGRWIERHRGLGYSLKTPRPETVDAIREALDEAAGIMSSTQGPGAAAYEQAKTISDRLSQELQVALHRERQGPDPRAGEKKRWTVFVDGENLSIRAAELAGSLLAVGGALHT
jgi:hypothetical protein